MVFGLTPSPAVLQGVIQHHLSRQKTTSDLAVIELLSKTLYVDDFPGGAADVEKGYHLYCVAKGILRKGGFNLCKWRTNNTLLQQKIDGAERELGEDIPVSQPADKPIKILGLGWNVSRDQFAVDFTKLIQYLSSLPTKRSLLRVI